MNQSSILNRILFLVLPILIASVLVWLFFQGAQAGTGSVDPRDAEGKSLGSPLSQSVNPDLRMVFGDQTGLVLELQTREIRIDEDISMEGGCQILRVDGFGETDKPGWPRLPTRGAMLGIPYDADVEFQILETDVVSLEGTFDICPAPRQRYDEGSQGSIEYLGVEMWRDPQVYSTDRIITSELAELVMTGSIRSQRVAQVSFHPFQYNPKTGKIRYFRRIRVRLNFVSYQVYEERPGDVVNEGYFEDHLRATLLNYELARSWRKQPVQNLPSGQSLSPQNGNSYKILIEQRGIYKITYGDLQAAGAELTGLDPQTIRLTNQGNETAIHVYGEIDGVFDPTDWLLFYGEPVDTRYSGTNVYFLTWGGVPGKRMPLVDGTPGEGITPMIFETSLHLEENHLYFRTLPGSPDDDIWYWDNTYAVDEISDTVFLSTTMNHISSSPSISATLRGLVHGYAATPHHHMKVYLNENLVEDAIFPDQSEYAFQKEIPQNYLAEGVNLLAVESPLDGDGVMTITQDVLAINWFEIDYWDTYTAEGNQLYFDGDGAGDWKFEITNFTTDTLEVFDVTDPLSVTQIQNGSVLPDGMTYKYVFQQNISEERNYYILPVTDFLSPVGIVVDFPSDLHSTSNGADHIIITHADFYTDMLALRDWRAAQGLRAMVVDVDDIYDEFNGGVMHPQSIHDFLDYAYHNWQPPSPAFVVLVGDGHSDPRDYTETGDPFWMPPFMVQADPWLGDVASENQFVTVSGSDILPDIHIGRLPARTSAQAAGMVAKILDYEQNPPSVERASRVLFVADNADGAGNFAALSDSIANNYLPSSHSAIKVYYQITHFNPGAVAGAVLNETNLGLFMVNYTGHGSVQAWAHEWLFGVNHIASMNNAGRLPFWVPMTCLTGSFYYPNPIGFDLSALSEKLVREPGDGAIAGFAPTGLGVASGHDFLNRGLLLAIFSQGITQAGAAATQAKLYLFANSGGAFHDLIETYVYFGDPALQLTPYATFFPTVFH